MNSDGVSSVPDAFAERDVVEHALHVALLLHGVDHLRHVQPDLARIVQEVGHGERILTREQDVVVGPERVLLGGAFGEPARRRWPSWRADRRCRHA